MKTGMKNLLLVATAVTALLSGSVLAQEIPRTPDGKPDLNGIWQTMGTAHWNLETQASKPGPASAVSMGALAALPGGQGVVVGGTIPYRPEALAKKLENQANWLELDPVVKCY